MKTFDNPYFIPHRHSSLREYRTGYIFFKICESNKIKLQKIYNLGNECAFLGIFQVIKVDPKHDNYGEFVKYVRENMQYLEEIGAKFQNPDIDIQELCNIIDKGIAIKNNLRKDGVSK